MVGEGSSSGAKRSAYHDLDSSDWDDIVATPMEIPTASNMQSAPSSTSEGKKKQKASAHEKNPQHPPKQYGILLGKRSWNGTTKKLQVRWSEHTFSIIQMGL
jgi:hypothetical protein